MGLYRTTIKHLSSLPIPLMLLFVSVCPIGDVTGDETTSTPVSPALGGSASIASRYRLLLETHRQKAAESVRDREQMQSHYQRFLGDIRALESEVSTDNLDSLSASDLAALAEGCEYLKEREKSITLSRKALQKDPANSDGYFPLIRSLLNLNRTDEAEAALTQAEHHLPKSQAIGACHFFIYAKASYDNQPNRAAMHLFAYIESEAKYFREHREETAHTLTRHLDDLFILAHQTAQTEKALALYKRLLNLIDDETDIPLADSKEEGIERRDGAESSVQDVSSSPPSILRLRGDLRRLLDDNDFCEDYIRWLHEIIRRYRQDGNVMALNYHLQEALNHIRATSSAVKEPNRLVTAVDSVRTNVDGEGNNDEKKDYPGTATVDALEMLDRFKKDVQREETLRVAVTNKEVEFAWFDQRIPGDETAEAPVAMVIHVVDINVRPNHSDYVWLAGLGSTFPVDDLRVALVVTNLQSVSGFKPRLEQKEIDRRLLEVKQRLEHLVVERLGGRVDISTVKMHLPFCDKHGIENGGITFVYNGNGEIQATVVGIGRPQVSHIIKHVADLVELRASNTRDSN